MTRLPTPDLINKIKQLTIDEIVKNGIQNISMRKIAYLADITPTTIYYYFKNKLDLFEEIKKDGFIKLNNFILLNLNENQNYKQQLQDIIKLFIKWITENINLFDLIFDSLPPNIDADDESYSHYYTLFYKVIDILNKGKKNKEFYFEDAIIETNIGFAMIFGIIKLYINKRISKEYWNNLDPLVNKIIDLLIQSLTKPDY